ncbi:sigma-70 family RNA polymerase sigma factor [Rufibacter immobilis]|uniref:Sigma-70 family RNA polymerase sigma factor n=1 Tax=Rufibacter immobilis TaxID=1348778 RepID=A0A3M9MZD0_9BACT|nr:sigma-70 family RNA polymerase sigma factor [Rufibacter immobilis]RNI30922.1 sigma-70 family RNA polymerase sigma factor [Rufibacter immobilis]
MTLEEIYDTIEANRNKLKKQIYQNVDRFLKIHLSREELEDLLSDVVLLTVEKMVSGEKTEGDFNTEANLLNYLSKTACQKLKDDIRKQGVSKKYYNEKYYLDEYLTDVSQRPEPDFSTSEVYRNAMEFVYGRYDWIRAGIFKTYAVNKITYSQLAEVTGYSRSRCYLIVKLIREDIRRNLPLILKSDDVPMCLNGKALNTYL